jgi:acetyl-CoA acetyltransferase
MTNLKDKACIVGIGHTEFSKNSGRSETALACEAITKAAEDAGISRKEVDGITKYSIDNCDPNFLQANLGIPRLRFFAESCYGGPGSVMTIILAAMAVASGTANYVAAFRSLNERSGLGTRRFGQAPGGEQAGAEGRYGRIGSFHHPFGYFTPAQATAIAARKHMQLYGTQIKHFGHISVACRKHAQSYPHAQMYGRPMTLEDHAKSRLIADPVRLLDCCLETDGAAAVIVTTPERAKDLKHRPVYLMSHASAAMPEHQFSMLKDVEAKESEFTLMRDDLFGAAGVTHKDVDVLFVYDHFTPLVLMAIEEIGFCKRGEGGPFVEGGRLEWPNGSLPLNTSGGNLSEGYIHGFVNNMEAVRQLRGTSNNQVKDAEVALVLSAPAAPAHGMILHR